MPTALQASFSDVLFHLLRLVSSSSGFSFAQAVIKAPQAECLIVCIRKSHSWASQLTMTTLLPLVKYKDVIKGIMNLKLTIYFLKIDKTGVIARSLHIYDSEMSYFQLTSQISLIFPTPALFKSTGTSVGSYFKMKNMLV